MPAIPDCPPAAGALARARIGGETITPKDVKPSWLDNMVKRLFKELNKQLARIEATKPDDNDPKTASVRVHNIRALSSIEQTLERLARLEQQRVASRKVRSLARNEELRIKIEHRIDRIIAARRAQNPAEEDEG